MGKSQWTTSFKRSEKAYRSFLTKFIEKPKFESESIGIAVEYACKVALKRNKPLHTNTKTALIDTILKYKKKVLEDLNVLKDFPETTIKALVPRIRLRKLKKIASEVPPNEENKRYNNDDLTNTICKKLKLSPTENNLKCSVNKWKKKYVSQRKNYRKNPLLRNKHFDKFLNISKKKNIQALHETRVPIVLLENDESIQEMAKSFYTMKKFKEKHNESTDEDDNYGDRCYKEENDHRDEMEIERNTSLPSEQKVSNKCRIFNENLNFSQAERTIFIKEEVDLLENNPPPTNSSESVISISEVHYACDEEQEEEEEHNETVFASEIGTHSQLSDNTFDTSTPSYRQGLENMSSLQICNNKIFPDHPIYGAQSIQNAARGRKANCDACLQTLIPPFYPGMNLINPNGLLDYCWLCNQYTPNSFHPNVMLPFQNIGSPLNNQVVNPIQEIAKLQTTIINLNSQLSALQSVVIQSHSSCVKKNNS